jgi:hypothetical protein
MSATRKVSALEISLAASGVRSVAVRRGAARRLYVSDVHSPNLTVDQAGMLILATA